MKIFSSMALSKRITFASLALLFSGCASQPPQVEFISDIEFRDANFSRCVTESGYQRVEDVVEISCFNQAITHLDELKYFPNLQRLLLVKNNIASIDLTHNAELLELNLMRNQLSQLDVSHSLKLERLLLGYNQLSELELQQNTQLTSLMAPNNQLKQLSLQTLPLLDTVSVAKNQLTTLDISANPQLRKLYLYKNPIHTLDVRHNPELIELGLNDHSLTEIDLSNNPKLSSLKIGNGQLASIDLSHNPNLSHINVENNQLKALDVSAMPLLKKLAVNFNQLTELDTSQNPELEVVSLEGNPIAPTAKTKPISQLVAPQVTVLEAGIILKQDNQYRIEPAEVITPQLQRYIGFRYSVSLPSLTAEQKQRLDKENHKLPITVRMTHPPIKDSKTGQVSRVSSLPDTMFLHDKNLAMWYFSDKAELVEGDWRLEIIYNDLVLASERFILDSRAKNTLARTLTDSTVYLQLKEEGEQLLCERSGYTECLGVTVQTCVEEARQIKPGCLALAEQKVPNIKDSAQFKQFMGQFVGCMSVVQARQNHLQLQKFGQCLDEKANR